MPTTPAPTPTPSVSNTAAICLAVSAVAAAGLAGLVIIGLATPLRPTHGIVWVLATVGLLAAVCSVFGFAYISRTAEERIGRREAAAVRLVLDRIDRVEERVDEHAANLTEQGADNFASAYVAGAAGSRHLTAVPRQG